MPCFKNIRNDMELIGLSEVVWVWRSGRSRGRVRIGCCGWELGGDSSFEDGSENGNGIASHPETLWALKSDSGHHLWVEEVSLPCN